MSTASSISVSAVACDETATSAARRLQLENAALFMELARRTEAPFDALPSGSAAQARVLLWKEAAYCALSAANSQRPWPSDLTRALAAAPHDLVAPAAGGAAFLPAVERALAHDHRALDGELDVSADAQARILAAFTRALVRELEAPAREVERRRLKLLSKVLSALAALAVLWLAFGWLRRGPDRTLSAIMTTSSQYKDCRDSSGCGNAFFHTNEEDNPWLRYHFGGEIELHEIEIENRSDCCHERAVPLVVETSRNGKDWREQARTERVFAKWSAGLDTKARFLRVRVLRKSFLHLQRVTIR